VKQPKRSQARHEQVDPFLLRALAKAALTVCFQFRKPPRIPVSLFATAAGLPITSARWSRLERDKLIIWENAGWLLTADGARILHAGGLKFPPQIVKGNLS
jgi:hypothetical protein